jgi:hypothetical protein
VEGAQRWKKGTDPGLHKVQFIRDLSIDTCLEDIRWRVSPSPEVGGRDI